MKLEGAYDVPAPRKKVWDAFFDPKMLKKAIPGCEKLEAVGPDEYKATMKVGVGGVKGTFEGKVKLTDKIAKLPAFDPTGTMTSLTFADPIYWAANTDAWTKQWDRISKGS